MNLFQTVFVIPVVNIVVLLYTAFYSMGIPGALGWAIITISSVMRLAIHPLMHRQMVQAQKMNELQPHIAKLQQKHKGNPQKMQQAQMELFKTHNVNPLFGCVVLIIQLPIFYGLYNALQLFVKGSTPVGLAAINQKLYNFVKPIVVFDPYFFGFNLSVAPSQWRTVGWWYLIIPVLTAGLQAWQSWLTTKKPSSPVAIEKKENRKENEVPEKKNDDMQGMMQKQMLFLFPLMIGFAAYNFPVGIALYWNIFTAFGIIQYFQIKKMREKASLVKPAKSSGK